MGRSREKAIAFVGICAIAVVVVLKNVSVLHSRGSLVQGRREQPVEKVRPVAKVTKVAICILTRRSEWRRRHLVRQTWLQDVPNGAQVSHIFVMGEDESYTPEENARLAAEVETHRDILIAPVEEAGETMSEMTKHCIYWTTRNHDFDVLVKTSDDSTLFLSRLFGEKGWLPPQAVKPEGLLYFGKRRALTRVPNPANFRDPATKSDPPSGVPAVGTGVDRGVFEFDYRGVYWPEHMEGGMYGLSRGLAEEIVKSDFRTYTSEEATIGVWVSAFNADVAYLGDDQVLSSEGDYLSSNGTAVAAAFRTCRLRLASMWCEYAPLGKLSPRSILAKDVPQTLDCLGSYERGLHAPRSLPLGARESHQTATLESINRKSPVAKRPNTDETGRWWAHMGGAFRGTPAAVVGTSATTVDRMPLYLLQGMHTLVLDDFFRVSERYTSWAPTMYMCVDPDLCASPDGGGGARGGGRVRGAGRRAGAARTVESANRFARDVFAAFYVLSGGIDGAEYWRYLRQRVNAHWFVAGVGDEEGGGGAAGMGPADGGGRGAAETSPENLRVLARTSGLAMSIEILSFLGFSPIYVTAANEELGVGGGPAAVQRWEEFSRAVRTASSAYGTKVIYLYVDEEDKLPTGRVVPQPAWRSGGGGGDKGVVEATAAGKLSAQEDILAFAKARSYAQGERSARWDLELFLRHFPVVSRLEVVRGASTVEGMFPRSPGCRRDADDLDRFQKAVLCPVKTSLKHFSSFLSWHVPYGPVRGTFVWVKR